MQRRSFVQAYAPKLGLKIIVLLLIMPILWACQSKQIALPSTRSPDLITPYWTATPSPTAPVQTNAGSATPVAIPATVPPPPTATPFTYVVAKDDTMGVLAYRFGVTVADLKAANPEVDPNLMSVGTVLVIPIIEKNGAGTPESLASPTPIPIKIDAPNCYRIASGGAWCVALAHNDQNQSVENLIVWIQVVSPDSEVLDGQQAIAPLNLLPAGTNLPVMAFFPEAAPSDSSSQAELISALPVSPGDQRYRPTKIQIERTEISPNGLQATVRGTMTLLALPSATISVENQQQSTPELTPTAATDSESEDNGHANQVWLAISAYDADNLPVGVRKWEAAPDLSPGAELPFEVTVYSLGPRINRVEVLSEARP